MCQEYGGTLVLPRSAQETDILKKLTTKRVWLGMTDLDKEGTWKSITTGETVTGYTNWASARPNGNGDYGHTRNSNQEWDDYVPDENNYVDAVVCERGKIYILINNINPVPSHFILYQFLSL